MELKRPSNQPQESSAPSDWQAISLGDIGRWLSGGTPSMANPAYWNGVIPWASPKDMKVSRLVDAVDHVTERALGNGARLIPAGALLMVVRGMILAHSFPVARAERPFAFNQDLKAVVTREDIDSNFVLHWLAGHEQQLRSLATESTHGTKRVPTEGLFRTKCMCPPLPEQRAIAAALGDVDALLEALTRLIAKKRDLKQSAMQQLLTGRTRLPGFTGGWEVKRLGQISEVAIGRTPRRRTGEYWGRGYVWLSISDLESKVVVESNEEITKLGAVGMTMVPKGTLMMSFKLSIGRLAFAGCDLFTNEAICSFRKLQANADYLYYALGRTDFSLYGKQAVKGYTLNMESLRQIAICLPPRSEQDAIAAVLSDMDDEVGALEARLARTRALKQGMMQELLTGRTRLV